MSLAVRRRTVPVMVGSVQVGGGAPVVVQSMTNTDTEDAAATAEQAVSLAEAGSELVRITVNTPKAARNVPEIVTRVRDAGCPAPVIGDFHYNGHRLLRECPDCAAALDKYRINPGNVGRGDKHGGHFNTICGIARDHGKPVRIGVNAGSLDPELLAAEMRKNQDHERGKTPEDVVNACMIRSALESTESALASGLTPQQIILSVKTSVPAHLIQLYRELAGATEQPLHLGLTEAGMGVKGLVWSAASMGVLLAEGIGDTIRISLTPEPGADRRQEVYAAQELLQSLGLRRFAPSVTACPGCGRTSSTVFQELAKRTQDHVRARLPEWRRKHPGVEGLSVAVMGCVVNGPGESKAAGIGISLPGRGERPGCPVYMDGEKRATLRGAKEEVAEQFLALLDEYVASKYPVPGT